MNEAGPSEQTRLALIRSALTLFGEKGFEATSTREIAAGARANIGSIAYHFGGKQGLREACADFIVGTIKGIAGRAMPDEPEAELSQLAAEAARMRLKTVIDTMVSFLMIQPQAEAIVQFMLRELAHPTATLDTIYNGVFEPTHKRLCRLWEAATGEPAESERTRIAVFAMLGQVVYFRIGREVIARRLGWREIGQREAGMVASVVKDNLAAALDRRGSGEEGGRQ